MKSTQAFIDTRDHKTAVIVWADDPGVFFVVKIDHAGGADKWHEVEIAMTQQHATERATEFLSEGDKSE